jgi:thiol reductant ABC exporter CydC subunit
MSTALVRLSLEAVRHRRRFALSVALGICAVGAGIGLMATSGYLISKAALEPPILTLTVAIVGVRFFATVRAVTRYLERLASHDLAFRVLADLRVRFYERVVPLVPGRLRSADLVSCFVADVDSLQHLYLRALAPPLVALGAIGVAVGVSAFILPAAALVLLAGLLLGGIAVPLLGGLASRASGRRRAPARAELTVELDELLRGAPELVVYGRQADAHRRIARADASLTRLARRDAVVAGLTGALDTLLVGATVVGVVAVGAGRVDGVYLATLAFCALASFEAVVPLAAAAQHLSGAAGAAERLDDVVANASPVTDPAAPRQVDGPCILEFDGVTVAPGRRVALVGASGSGKTTLAHVLVRFRELEGWRPTLDGHDLREYAQDKVRSTIVLAGEDAYLFAATIRDNLLVGRPTAGDDELHAALARAGASKWIASLRDGLDTDVGEDGALVSGGQRQRIALARALLADARIAIFDEPTAHLDADAASAFVHDLLAATGHVGLLMITHRLMGLDRFDEIVVLDRGRIVERGTEAELLARRGTYAALARV